ncbi:DUF1848 domain-containing protein [Anaerosacchariphilus polymeriproducens]|uniref:DUF1848 domain-containing protein n=1 Tax=Anaerosacchariphilus polymeriproducens TaxID=1812858 RepID=A0A371AVL7_9FIRM|nr:DUF1848 domain-containing protein [Anaerosacchariphilus polymeriproducens]RDU23625.1 DUF1848 domain-containing protein [Anaerosacchariphilus polymeriproducens]
MILSASRRTDIPNYYSDWFLNRLKEGHLYVRNPINIYQVSKIDVSPKNVDCIVFWTKNPEPMLQKLDELKDYKYYFQFTLTGYGKDLEPNVPDKKNYMIPIFQELSNKIGKEKVIWRYDPILITEKYSLDYHIKAFTKIAENLNGYTNKVIISFLDLYLKTKRNMKNIKVQEIEDIENFTGQLAQIAKKNQLLIDTCAEKIDLSKYGIGRSSCIDKTLIEQIIGSKIKVKKDKNQRNECGCMESIDIGCYDTCKNECIYCYANENCNKVKENLKVYNPYSPILCSELDEKDKITERKLKSLKEEQLSFFN